MLFVFVCIFYLKCIIATIQVLGAKNKKTKKKQNLFHVQPTSIVAVAIRGDLMLQTDILFIPRTTYYHMQT